MKHILQVWSLKCRYEEMLGELGVGIRQKHCFCLLEIENRVQILTHNPNEGTPSCVMAQRSYTGLIPAVVCHISHFLDMEIVVP